MRSCQAAPFSAAIHQKVLPRLAGHQVFRVRSKKSACDSSSVVIFEAQVRDQVFATEISQSIFEFHQLDKDIVFRI